LYLGAPFFGVGRARLLSFNSGRVARALGVFEFVGAPSFGFGRAGLLSRLSSPGHEKSAFLFDIQMQGDRLNSKTEDVILASKLKDNHEAQEKQHIETGTRE